MNLKLKIESEAGTVLASVSGTNETTLVYEPLYKPGDSIIVECNETDAFLVLQLDDAMPAATVLLSEKKYIFSVPFGEKRVAYSPRAFMGEWHVLHVRTATPAETGMNRNLAFNPWDAHSNNTLYPHAEANVETRGESVFAARNAIDGVKANHSHGLWPFQSWGINQNPEAEFKLDFGRDVLIDKAVIYLRADFPHDAWWEQITLTFSDGGSLDVPLKKTSDGQVVEFTPRTVRWVMFHKLIKADDPSPFPALSQIEFWGTEAQNK